MKSISLLSTSALLMLSAGHAAQAARIRSTQFSSTFGGSAAFGTTITGLKSVNAGSIPDFAVGAPNHNAGGTGAGRVEMFDGATGTTLWARAGTASSRLGSTLTTMRDVTGDGISDLLVGAPGAATFLDLVVLNGATGAVTGITSSILGPLVSVTAFPTDVDPFLPDGEKDFAVIAGNSVSFVSSGITATTGGILPLITQPTLPQETVVSAAGDFFGTGPMCVALGAPSLNQVRVVDLLTGQQKLFSATSFFPGVTGMGTALDFDAVKSRILFGAPTSFGGIGAVGMIDSTSISLLLVGIPTTPQLGTTVLAGDVDKDGSSDILVGGAGSMRIALADGSTQNVTGSQSGGAGFTFGTGAAFVGDTNLDGFDDFVVGTAGSPIGGVTDLFMGGPTSNANQSFGAGCSPVAFTPSISIPSTPALQAGRPFAINIQNGFLSLGILAVGTPNAAGILVPGSAPGCTSWLNPGFTTLATLATDINGNASFVSSSVTPISLIGLTFAFQEFVLYPGVAPFALSNAVSAKVGW